MKNKIYLTIETLLLILAILGLHTVFHGCTGEMAVRCQNSIHVTELIFASIALWNILGIFKEKTTSLRVQTGKLLLYVDTILIPAWVVGGCKMPQMRCLAVAFPFIYVISALLLIITIVTIITLLRKKES